MKHRALIVAYILVIWFVISFVTNLIGPLMPIIIRDFQLSLAMAGFLPFSFFLAYGLVSIPGGLLVEAKGPRATILAAFLLSFTLSFDDVVISEFLSGPGVSTLPQVIFGYARRGINPTIYAAATLLITTVTIVIIGYSVWVARQTRKREREIQIAIAANK